MNWRSQAEFPTAVDHIGEQTIPSLLADRVASSPQKVALIFEDKEGAVVEYSYATVADRVARLASGFAELGVGAGDRVLTWLPNRPELVLSLLALAHLDAIGVPCNTASSAAEIDHIVSRTEPKAFVTTAAFKRALANVPAAASGSLEVVLAGADAGSTGTPFSQLLDRDPFERPSGSSSETPLEIIFTSGTTASPKGVVLTHANWLWAGVRASHWLRVDDRDRLLTALPLFHVNAQSFTLMASLTVGATAIFLEEYSASRFMFQLASHEATATSLVATVLRTLLAQPESAADRGHSLRRVAYAINVSDAEKETFEKRFGVELLNGYGLSEAMTEVSVSPVYGERRWPSVGRPAFGREVRIATENGDAAPGEIGEILVKGVPGRTIMKEYYRDREATERTIVDGWLHTGDNGYLDEDGFLFFWDRAKDVIKRAGENVSASEVEAVLTRHPEIAQAAVIGVPDPMRDEAVMAFVVTLPGASLSEEGVKEHCASSLARFKVPTIVSFRDVLPTTSIGKVEKKVLRAEVASHE